MRFGTILQLAALLSVMQVALSPVSASAQVDSTSLHATLSGWDESNWLQFLNRDAADGGRMSTLGILQRFHENIDFEYEMDRLTSQFSLVEDYSWYRLQDDGVRWRGGSINKRDILTRVQFKTTISIGKSWDFKLRFDKKVSPVTDRSRLTFAFDKSWNSGLFAFAKGSLDALKTDSDVEFGVGWRSSALTNPRHEARLSLAVVDWANNLVYVRLNAAEQTPIDSTLAYDKQPLALRGSVSSGITQTLRLEAFGALAAPSTLDQYEGFTPDQGIRHEERFGYAGGLVEWSIRPNLRIGGFGTYIEARTVRSALSADQGVEEYRLVEATTNLGAFGLFGMGKSWHLEAIIARNWRPEERDYVDSTLTDVDYLDQSWTGKLLARRSAPRGLMTDLGFYWDARDIARGAGQVPSAGNLGWHNYRLNVMVGWRFNVNFMFLIGAGLDMDALPQIQGLFDGLKARFTVVW